MSSSPNTVITVTNSCLQQVLGGGSLQRADIKASRCSWSAVCLHWTVLRWCDYGYTGRLSCADSAYYTTHFTYTTHSIYTTHSTYYAIFFLDVLQLNTRHGHHNRGCLFSSSFIIWMLFRDCYWLFCHCFSVLRLGSTLLTDCYIIGFLLQCRPFLCLDCTALCRLFIEWLFYSSISPCSWWCHELVRWSDGWAALFCSVSLGLTSSHSPLIMFALIHRWAYWYNTTAETVAERLLC